MYEEAKLPGQPQHLEMAEKMVSEIKQLEPIKQNEVVKYITQLIRDNRLNQIEDLDQHLKQLKASLDLLDQK